MYRRSVVAVEGGGAAALENMVIVSIVHYGANKERGRLLFVISLQFI